jgi:small-conductance mechanosensitive channel
MGLFEPSGLGTRIDAELDLLAAGAFGRWAVFAAVVAVVAWAIIWGTRRGVKFVEDRWAEEEQRLESVAGAFEIAVVLVAGVIALRPLVAKAPLVVGLVVIALLLVAARIATPWARNLLAGVSLNRRQTFREGDVIAVAGREGVVCRIGLWRTILLSEDGSRRSIPNRAIAGEEITVAATGGVARVRVDVELPTSATEAQLERIRHALLASPFRHPGGVVSVEPGDGKTISAEIETWARDRAEEVQRRISRRVVAVALARGDSA